MLRKLTDLVLLDIIVLLELHTLFLVLLVLSQKEFKSILFSLANSALLATTVL